MSADLYQRCSICLGSLSITSDTDGKSPVRTACPCYRSPNPGWAKVGLTMGQVERMQKVAKMAFGIIDAFSRNEYVPEIEAQGVARELIAAFGITPPVRGIK